MASIEKKDEIFPVDENDTDVMVTITLEDDTELDCEIIVIFEADAQDYIALLPVDKDGNSIEEMGILLYRYFETSDGTPVLDNIDSEDEASYVSEVFEELLEDEIDDE
ncbi:MAG: DUF1292 domain-containing protein [Lachnospiraceae bacterium]|nr:DUF1292 domain-containing protein [Lachnospiraceae bacterium]